MKKFALIIVELWNKNLNSVKYTQALESIFHVWGEIMEEDVNIVQRLKMRPGRFIQVHSRTFRPHFSPLSHIFVSKCTKFFNATKKSVFEGRNMSNPADFALASNSKGVSRLYDYSTTSIFPERDTLDRSICNDLSEYNGASSAKEYVRVVALFIGR